MKKIIFTILLNVISICLFSQTYQLIDDDAVDRDISELEVLPCYKNNNYIEQFLDSIGYPSAGSGKRIVSASQVKFWIPI